MATRRIAGPLAGVAALLALAAPGCATRNGSVAAFCAQLPKTKAVNRLATMVTSGSLSQAGSLTALADQIDQEARSMRSLERAAPRAVRADVATTADFAEHLANRLRHVQRWYPSGQPSASLPAATATTAAPGATATTAAPTAAPIPVITIDPTVDAASWVLEHYPGAARATARFVSYASDHCGAGVLPQDYQSPGYLPGDSGLGGPFN